MDTGRGGWTAPSCEWWGLKVRRFLQLPPHKQVRAIPAGARPREKKENQKVEKADYRSSWSPLCKKEKEKLEHYCLAYRYEKGNTPRADCALHARI